MPTEELYYVNQYQTEAVATVRCCTPCATGWEVLLDRTVFYPTGGGQPCDRGTLGGADVLDVFSRDGEVVHVCAAPLESGVRVLCRIDWQRRFALMQQHSGEHLLSGIIHSRFGYDNVGFHMGADTVTVDFSGELTDLPGLEQAVNEAVWRNVKTEIFYPDAETLKALPYRSKKELTGRVRLVRFPGYDLCACCGLHVASTGEIGVIKLLSAVRFRGGSRLELLCGGPALAYLNGVCDQNREISALLSAKPTQTAAAVARQKDELAAARYRVVQLENELFERKAADGALFFEPPIEPDALRRLTDAVLRRQGRAAVFAGADGAYRYALAVAGGDLRGFVRAMNDALHGRGGGKPEFAQGSLSATRAQIEAFLASGKR